MNEPVFLIDFARCARGHYTAIHPTKIATPIGDQKWKETGDQPEFFVCRQCTRIYPLNSESLEAFGVPLGLEPYNPGAPIKRFDIPLKCEEELHCLPIVVIAVLKSDTTSRELEEAISTWQGQGLHCPNGHVQDFPCGWR